MAAVFQKEYEAKIKALKAGNDGVLPAGLSPSLRDLQTYVDARVTDMARSLAQLPNGRPLGILRNADAAQIQTAAVAGPQPAASHGSAAEPTSAQPRPEADLAPKPRRDGMSRAPAKGAVPAVQEIKPSGAPASAVIKPTVVASGPNP